jgi:hypothetical protein
MMGAGATTVGFGAGGGGGGVGDGFGAGGGGGGVDVVFGGGGGFGVVVVCTFVVEVVLGASMGSTRTVCSMKTGPLDGDAPSVTVTVTTSVTISQTMAFLWSWLCTGDAATRAAPNTQRIEEERIFPIRLDWWFLFMLL